LANQPKIISNAFRAVKKSAYASAKRWRQRRRLRQCLV